MKNVMWSVGTLAAVLLLTLMTGCGGGSSTEGGLTPKPPHVLLVNDTFQYTVSSGLLRSPDGGEFTLTGTKNVAIQNGIMFNGETVLARVSSLALSTTEGIPFSTESTTYFKQPGTLEFIEYGDKNGVGDVRTLTTPISLLPATWTLETAYDKSVVYHYDNGDTLNARYQITGTQNVSTPLGTFSAFVAKFSSTSSNGDVQETTYWFVPHIGMPVKESTQAISADGLQLSYTAVLNATNVTY